MTSQALVGKLALEAVLVVAAIAALPAEQTRVLIMPDVQGYPERMVAVPLGQSSAAMQSRLHRARVAVRAALSSEPDSVEGDRDD